MSALADVERGYVSGMHDALEVAAASVRATGDVLADRIAFAVLDLPPARGSRKTRGPETVAMRDAIVDVLAGLADELDARALMVHDDPIITDLASAAAALEPLDVDGSAVATGRGYLPGGGGTHASSSRGYLWVPCAIFCCLFWRWFFGRKASK
jgi:hypothetical protein